MIYLLLALAFLIFILISFSRENERKILAEIRLNWGRRINRKRDIELVEKYAIQNNAPHFHKLTHQTLKDIDIENLFALLDRTLTAIGQQLLYNKIIFPGNSLQELKKNDENSDYFKREPTKREAVQIILYKLEKNGTGGIADLLSIKKSGIDKNLRLYKLLTGIAVAGLIAAAFFPVLLIYLIPIFGVNIMIQYVFKYRNESQYQSVGEIYGLIKAAEKLQKTDTIIDGAHIPQHLKSLNPFVKNYGLLNFGIPGDDLTKALFYILELVKACFLLELHLLNKSYSQIINQRESIKKLFEYIGEFDLAISMASLKSDPGFVTCTPELVSENKILKFTNAIHPLIENCVPNSLTLEQKSAFITGSNMSGKSTFLRTILINSILSQTIYLCFAETFTSSFLKPFSSITIEDDLFEGSSYFFTEVEIVKAMTEQAFLSPNHLFVIDETFKGTNTLERISLAKAVLEFLNDNENIVIASSHDLELIELISKNFELFYFTETIKDNYLKFDHTVKPGFLKTTNAIKIVEIEDYPKAIIDEAYKITRDYKPGTFVSNSEKE
jgi:DNA mismatch repair ATPase MutS